MRQLWITLKGVLLVGTATAQYAPAANETGTTALFKDSAAFVNWANLVVAIERGPRNIAVAGSPSVDFGEETNALGKAEGNGTEVVSLGDGGTIVLGFPHPIRDGAGHDFAVFENSFDHDFLELAHVEVSTDGLRFVRIPSVSLTPTEEQIGGFGTLRADQIHNLAGTYMQGYGTPFDLQDVADSSGIDLENIRYVKVVDAIGSIAPASGSRDSQGNLINDPYPTDFASGGFDLDAIGVLHENNPLGNATAAVPPATVYPNPLGENRIAYVEHATATSFILRDNWGTPLLRGKLNGALPTALHLKDYVTASAVYLLQLGDQTIRIVCP